MEKSPKSDSIAWDKSEWHWYKNEKKKIIHTLPRQSRAQETDA